MAKDNWKDDRKSPKTPAVEPKATVTEQDRLEPRTQHRRIDPERLKRAKIRSDDELNREPLSVSAGPVDKVIELAFNPTREKIREVTIIDRLQGRLFPIMDAMNTLYRYCVEVAAYRQSRDRFKSVFKREVPGDVDIIDEIMFRVAQWQKSVAGKNLERATDIALAETEARAGEGEELGGTDPWKDD